MREARQHPAVAGPADAMEHFSGLAKDAWVRVCMALVFLAAVPYWAGALSPESLGLYGEYWVGIPLTLFATATLAMRSWTSTHPREMRLWRLWALAFGLWAIGQLLMALMPIHLWENLEVSLSLEAIYTAFYLCLAISLELHPLSSTEDLSRRLKAFEATGGLIMVFGAVFYFMLIPLNLSPDSLNYYAPSLLMFVVMDAYLVFRLVALSGRARGSLQPMVYLLLASAMGWCFLTDLYEYLSWEEFVPWVSGGTPFDLLWLPASVLVIFAARLKSKGKVDFEVVMPTERRQIAPVKPGLLVVYAGAFPFLHTILYRLNLLDEVTERPRLLAAIIFMLLLAGLAVTFQRLLDEERTRLETDRLLESHNKGAAGKMEALGRMAGGIAHDFNNLLTVISCSQEVAKNKSEPDDEIHEWLDEIGDAAERARLLTQQLLAFSRQLPSRPVALCTNKLIEANARSMRTLLGSRIELVTSNDGSPAWVNVDPTQLQRVLLNLAANSRDAMPDGGRFEVECSTTRLELEPASVRNLEPGNFVVINVRDTGSGLDEVASVKLFEPFFTTKEKGTGLGLAASFGILQRFGGYIEAGNASSGGAQFTVFLPAVDAPTKEDVAQAPPSMVDFTPQAGTLLLAEDEVAVRKLMSHMLAENGYTVLEAGNAEEALAVAESFDSPIDLLLTDVFMPDMPGTDLAVKLLTTRPETKVAYLSGNPAGRRLASQGLHAGVPFLSKPFDSSTLAEFVDRALTRPPQ